MIIYYVTVYYTHTEPMYVIYAGIYYYYRGYPYIYIHRLVLLSGPQK